MLRIMSVDGASGAVGAAYWCEKEERGFAVAVNGALVDVAKCKKPVVKKAAERSSLVLPLPIDITDLINRNESKSTEIVVQSSSSSEHVVCIVVESSPTVASLVQRVQQRPAFSSQSTTTKVGGGHKDASDADASEDDI